MRFQYRTIRATPDPTRILEIGVGVLVTDPRNGNSIVATIERPESLPSQVQERDAIFSALRRLATRFRDTHSGANRIEFTDSDTATGLASRLEDHWNNFLTIDPPRTMSAESIEEASDLLFNIYIAAPRSETAPRSITRLRRTVQSAYRQHPAIERHLRQAPHLNTDMLSGEFDLAVTKNEEIFELNSSFTFTPQSTRAAENKIEAWNYRNDHLRRDGGQLTVPGETTQLEIDTNAPVVVTYFAPRTEAQTELFERMSRQWTQLGVRPIEADHIEAHARRLEHALAAS